MDNTTDFSNTEGCGSPPPLNTFPAPTLTVHIHPTTGGVFCLTVEQDSTVENFKKLVSKKLKVPRDRLCLLYQDKQLQDGSLAQHGVCDGSRIVLLPNVETGLVAQKPEIGIMQALESLNDTQVNEFLCGKAPLNLSMRLGDHMMLIQLQLSTVTGVKPHSCTSTETTTRPPSLLQASRNLQHTLRRLSADVFSGKDENGHGNVYSGTFSGALNPALQDTKGRPRRDVATIVHILNDLLCSAPDLQKVNCQNVEERINTASSSHAQTQSEDEDPISLASTSFNEDQNSRTRGKVERLRLVMDERRERRRQRKAKPYSVDNADNSVKA